MNRVGYRVWCGIFLVSGAFAALAWAEDAIEATSYVPVPPDRLHANRGTIGSAYRLESVPDNSVPNGNLLVSGNVGIGTTSPRSNPPNAAAAGNLEVNDIYLRAMNRWASQLAEGRTVAVENSSGVNIPPSSIQTEVLLVRVVVAASGRPVVALGNVRGSSSSELYARLYRDGTLMDQAGDFPMGFSSPQPRFMTVMKGETALSAGNHTFELRMLGSDGTVASGGAELTVMEI